MYAIILGKRKHLNDCASPASVNQVHTSPFRRTVDRSHKHAISGSEASALTTTLIVVSERRSCIRAVVLFAHAPEHGSLA